MNYREIKKLYQLHKKLSPEQMDDYLKKIQSRTGIYTKDLARALNVPEKRIEEMSEKKIYVQVSQISDIRCLLLGLDPSKTRPGLSIKECARLYCVPDTKLFFDKNRIFNMGIFSGIALWPDDYGDLIVPLRDVLHGYEYFEKLIEQKTR